jgi:hypothetical protein
MADLAPSSDSDARSSSPPPRAFTQGVGTVFQFVGVLLFVASMFVCCGSSLISKDVAQRHDLTMVGWSFGAGGGGTVVYSAQRAISLSVTLSVFFGLAVAGIGLGLQAQRRLAPWAGVAVCGFAVLFWGVHAVFAGQKLHSVTLTALTFLLFALFCVLTGLAAGALREMRRTPPPRDLEILPADYKVPYSHLHDDPPEVRLARELEQRRDRLAVQQKELEMLEGRLKRKLEQRDGSPRDGGET